MNIAWTIGGSDSGGGAGIQADLKTMNGLGIHGCSVITAITAQNTLGVTNVESISAAMVREQLEALSKDLPPKSIKLGMLYSKEIVDIVAAHLRQERALIPGSAGFSRHHILVSGSASLDNITLVVCDPVTTATSGDVLCSAEASKAIREIMPLSDLVTPNISEAHALLDSEIDPILRSQDAIAIDEYIEELAERLLTLGARNVLIKGGHRRSDFSQDYWTDGKSKGWLTSTRCNTKNVHGTGCTLASAISSALALDYSMLDAIVIGKAYVNQGLRNAQDIGNGSGPLAHLGWPESETDLPWLTTTAVNGRSRCEFDRDKEMGFYPIVNRAEWIRTLGSAGVRTIQLRIKDLEHDALEQEIVEAIKLSRQFESNLYVNDYWRLAIKHRAYGVHVGQEDLDTADVAEIHAAGLKLGISTHSYSEVARALAFRPSYIAIGPVFPTTTKVMKHNPQGLDALRRWRRSLSYPLVAIGGMFLSNSAEVLDCGVESIAVIRDIMESSEPSSRVAAWLNQFN